MADESKPDRDGREQRASSMKILRIEGSKRKAIKERVVSERTLVVSAQSETTARLQYLPGQEAELAAGFLVTSGLARPGAFNIQIAPVDSRTTRARVGVELDQTGLAAFRGHSSLAACGAPSECEPPETAREADGSFRIEARVVLEAMKRFRDRSELFRETGAVHSAMVTDAQGQELAFAEDIGRHNALDKAVGDCVLRRIPLSDRLLLTSGRLSVEMVSKCARAGLPLVASPGAPTDRAVELARAADLTLIGFARDGRMNVYAADWRLA